MLTSDRLAREQIADLYSAHAAGVRRFLLGVLRDVELADEGVQQTFLQVLEKGHTADPDTMKGWIYKVAFNEAMAVRRRHQVGERALETLKVEALRAVAGTDAPLLFDEELERAEAAIAELPAAQREVLRLRFTESRSFAEIAEQLGIPLGTALTRTRLAIGKLRRRLLK